MAEAEPSMQILTLKDLADLGLIYRINKEILHPLGYALSYDADTGDFTGVYVAPDKIWEYPPEVYELMDRVLKENKTEHCEQ